MKTIIMFSQKASDFLKAGCHSTLHEGGDNSNASTVKHSMCEFWLFLYLQLKIAVD